MPLKHIFLFLFIANVGAFVEASTRLSVMTYNVENLFDSKDDPNTNDETYLSLKQKKNPAHEKKCKSTAGFGNRLWDCMFLDWNEDLIHQKMKNLSEQIFLAPGGRGPDVLILAEVENKQVVEELNQRFLSKAGYKVYHHESHDARGIDQAILSRYPVKNEMYHEVSYEKQRKNKSRSKELRGIFHVKLDVKGKAVHVFALHLPSQGAPFQEREVVLNELNRLALSLPANEALVAGGDFNITSVEWEKKKIFPNYFENIWAVAFMKDCHSCVGTYYYAPKKQWSYFDLLLLRNDREKKQRWRWENPQVVRAANFHQPQRFDSRTGKGASDHFPFFAELVLE